MSLTTRIPRLIHVLRLGAVLLPALTACSGSDDDELPGGKMDAGGSADGGSADGSTPGGNDGGGDDGEPDGGTGPDASTVRGPMNFTLHYNRTPVPGAVVVLHGESGAAIGRLNTDALGQVHPAEAPHMLTVLPPPDFLGLMEGGPISYLGVEPGDNLIIELDQIGIDSPSEGSYSVTLPSLIPSANLYFVSAGSDDCGTSASNDGLPDDSFPLYTQCRRPEGIDVFAVAQQAGMGPLKYAYLKDQPVPAAGAVQEVALTAWVDPDLVTVSIVNADPEHSSYGTVISYRNGGRYWTGSSDDALIGTDTWQYETALGFFDSLGFTAEFNAEALDESVYSRLEELTLPKSTHQLDATRVLPPVRVGAIDTSTFTRPVITLVPEASRTADATVLNLEVNVNDAESSLFGTYWTFVAPPDATQLQLPDLSVYAQHLNEDLSNAASSSLRVLGAVAYEIDTVADYNAFRQLTVDFTSYTEGQSFEVRRPTPSLLRSTTWQQSQN